MKTQNIPRSTDAADALLARMAQEFASLSRQLKVIAQYVEQHRDHIGLERIQDVAQRCGVQPSAVVRFAKHFGFSGYTELQKIFRDGITKQIGPGRDYQARIRDLIDTAEGKLSSADIAQAFIEGSVSGMQDLQRNLSATTFDNAVNLLAQAPTVWIAGTRRSFPAASYLAYALQHTDKRVEFLTGLGGMNAGQMRSMTPHDVMLVISFAPYAPESMQCAEHALARGVSIIAMTDSQMCPLATMATAALLVPESATFGFRSLTNTMCLAQSLFIALAYQTELMHPHADGAA